MKQKGKNWIDGNGKEMPTYAISPSLQVEEKYAQKLADAALKAEKALEAFSNIAREAYSEVVEAKMKEANITGRKVPNAGISISSFDGEIEVKITKPEALTFDNTFTEIVKQKFDEYFNSLNARNDTAELLRDIVNDMLYTKGGTLDQSKVLKMRKYADRIKSNPKLYEKGKAFVEAVELFDKAIRTKAGSTGVYVEVPEPDRSKKRKVRLKYTDFM